MSFKDLLIGGLLLVAGAGLVIGGEAIAMKNSTVQDWVHNHVCTSQSAAGSENKELSAKYEELAQKYALLEEDRDKCLEQISSLNNSLSNELAEVERLTEENQNKANQIVDLTQDIESKRFRISDLERINNSLELNIIDLTTKNTSLNSTIEELNEDKQSNLAEITRLTNLYNENTQEIARLNSVCEENSQEISRLQNEVSSKQSTIEDLQSSINAKDEEIAGLNVSINSKNEEIINLTTTVGNLNFRITEVEDLLKQYDSTIRYVVAYRVQDDVVSREFIVKGNNSQVPADPDLELYDFKYWSVDGETEADPATYSITEDTTFIAVLEQKVGLYAEDNTRVKTWQELIDEDYLRVSETGELSNGDKVAEIEGKLYLSSDVKSTASPKSYSSIFEGSHISFIFFPSSVETIGKRVFYTGKYDAPSSSYPSLKKVVFSEGLKSIGEECFYGCSLKEIILPKSLESIGSSSFNFNSLCEYVSVNSNLSAQGGLSGIGMYTAGTTFELAEGVTSFGFPLNTNMTAYYCNISTIKLPSTYQGSITMSYDSGLREVIIDSVSTYTAIDSRNGWFSKYAKTIKVLKSIVDDSSNNNTYLNNSSNYYKAESGDYYVYVKK